MQTAEPFPAKKVFLYPLVASVLVSALLGIVALLSNRFGWVEVRIVLTTVTISLSSICGLACGAYLGTNAGRLLPLSGIVLTLSAAGMIIAGMWIEADSDTYWKIAASLSVFAVACAHLSLLSMARLAEWFRWSLVVARGIILFVASFVVLMIFVEPDGTAVFQLLGVAAIVDAAITILIPIFHRLSRHELASESPTEAAATREAIDAEIASLQHRIAELEQRKRSLA